MRAEATHRLVVQALSALLALPVLATLAYSLADRWDGTLLPQGLTLRWYAQLLVDQRFDLAFAHSLLICAGALALATAVILPAVFAIHVALPALDRWMNLLILLPFAVPPVVSSVGILSLYADGPLPLVGTPWILLGTGFTLALPFMYRMLSDGLRGLPVASLIDAARLLGCSTPRAFMLIILPCLRSSLFASLLISFSFLFGEFVFANMLVGSRYETLQVYLYDLRNGSGHFTSALVIADFGFTLFMTWLALRLQRGSRA